MVALQERVDALAREVNDSETRDSTDDSNRYPDPVVEEKVDPYQTMEARDHNYDSTLKIATMEGEQNVHGDQAVKESVDHAMETRCLSDSDHDHGSGRCNHGADHVDSNHTVKEFVDEEENLASGDEECGVNATQEAAREEGSANGVVGGKGNKRVDGRDLKELMEGENKKVQRTISELCEREVSQNRDDEQFVAKSGGAGEGGFQEEENQLLQCSQRKIRFVKLSKQVMILAIFLACVFVI